MEINKKSAEKYPLIVLSVTWFLVEKPWCLMILPMSDATFFYSTAQKAKQTYLKAVKK